MGLDFLREARWLGKARARGYLVLLAAVNLAALSFLLATSRGGIDRNGFLIGTDFLSFWTTGRMLHAGGDVYDMAAHIAAQRGFFAQPNGDFTAFFYPPGFLPFCWPLGGLGYFPALALWVLATGAFYAWVCRHWLRGVPDAPAWPLLLAAFPPVLITVTHGQTAFLLAGLLGLALRWAGPRPWLAGIALGLATIKPQFGLLVPFALLTTGQWRVTIAAVLTASALATCTIFWLGPGIWTEWLAVTQDAQRTMVAGAVGYAKMTSPMAAALLLGANPMLAYLVQGLVSAGLAAVVAAIGWRRGYSAGLAALVLAGAPLATPFVLDYDLVILAFPLIWLASRSFAPWSKAALALAFVMPAFARPLAMTTGMPIAPFVLALLFAVIAREAWRDARGAIAACPQGTAPAT